MATNNTLAKFLVCLIAQLVTPKLVKALIPHKREISRRDFASITSLVPLVIPSVSIAILDESQGIPAVTESSLGKTFRRSIIKGAQVADSLDERWERFSDGLRDKSQCDEQTGRRLYDNGKRKDGTSIGNPGLGSLCNPEPLMPLKPEVVAQIFNLAIASATSAGGKSEDVLRDSIKQVKTLVAPSFVRKEQQSATEDEKEKVRFNLDSYATLRAIATFLNDDKKAIRRFQTKWGQELVSVYAPSATSKDYISPFSEKKDEFQDYDYDKSKLLDSLGKLTVVLTQLKAAGIVGFFEISIPYDDYGSVVTVAVDDYSPIGSEILLSEQANKIEGPIQALVRYLIGAAGIDCSLDTFYIDPSTTRQVDYNPTQLLLSANGLRHI
jgi:hypothetical protein